MKWIFPGLIIITFLYGCKKDHHNTNSSTVTICNQTWMVKNLDVTSYRNGDPIPQVKDHTTWGSLTTGAWCWYGNDSAKFEKEFGKLYNWYAVNDPRGLAPQGWHVPSDIEWTILADCLGGQAVAGGKLKAPGTSHWLTPNTNATNVSGFTALPGEGRFPYFLMLLPPDKNLGGFGYWWSSTENGAGYAFYRILFSFSGALGIEITGKQKNHGFSVRCLKD